MEEKQSIPREMYAALDECIQRLEDIEKRSLPQQIEYTDLCMAARGITHFLKIQRDHLPL